MVLPRAARVQLGRPPFIGGGSSLTVVFIAGEKPLPQGLATDASSRRSVPCQLLTETDKAYVILSPEHGEESMEIARDGVQAMVVLKDSGRP